MSEHIHPHYYRSEGLEAVDFIEAHSLNFNRGNVIKYVTRAGRKNPDEEILDLEKARFYIDREINRLQKGK